MNMQPRYNKTINNTVLSIEDQDALSVFYYYFFYFFTLLWPCSRCIQIALLLNMRIMRKQPLDVLL